MTKIKLGNALSEKCNELMTSGATNTKEYEAAFQDIIEQMYPGKCWWQVTDCQIFMHLFEHKDPRATVMAILGGMKDEI